MTGPQAIDPGPPSSTFSASAPDCHWLSAKDEGPGALSLARFWSALRYGFAASERRALCFAVGVVASILGASGLKAADAPPTIEGLLADGWEIAGYASGYDNRTSLILFRHPGRNALVQCGVLYDVTRSPRTVVNCYELR
jgi:hypothetical protein